MKLSKRQEQIIDIVKRTQPVSGEKIAELLNISRATLRSDLSFLTLVGVLQAAPKVGYTYVGNNLESMFFFEWFQTKVSEFMVPPLVIHKETTIRDAITTLFMYDVGSLYVTDEAQRLAGILSRKDLLRAALNSDIDQTPVAVCMTRVPHVKVCTMQMELLEVATILQDFEVDSLPVVEVEEPTKVIGKVTKTQVLNFITQKAKQIELNR